MVENPFFKDICERAIMKHGLRAQMDQTQEECAELIVAINHHRRKREGAWSEILEEVTDVRIMVEQVLSQFTASEREEMMTRKLKKTTEGF